MLPDFDLTNVEAMAREAAADQELVRMRFELATFTAEIFSKLGGEFHEIGHIFGPDRKDGVSPGGHGSDEIVAVSLLLRIGGQLVSASADLFSDGRGYAAAALVRQLVEIEYLAWAFQTHDRDAERWLRSSREERESFFRPAKLRKASEGQFRSKDYGYHCELGGHPVPGAYVLLRDDLPTGQLMLSDMLGHAGRIWDHILDWGAANTWVAPLVLRFREDMFRRYTEWQSADGLTKLPPPP